MNNHEVNFVVSELKSLSYRFSKFNAQLFSGIFFFRRESMVVCHV